MPDFFVGNVKTVYGWLACGFRFVTYCGPDGCITPAVLHSETAVAGVPNGRFRGAKRAMLQCQTCLMAMRVRKSDSAKVHRHHIRPPRAALPFRCRGCRQRLFSWCSPTSPGCANFVLFFRNNLKFASVCSMPRPFLLPFRSKTLTLHLFKSK